MNHVVQFGMEPVEQKTSEIDEAVSFGGHLKQARAAKGISLEEISAITKISMHVLLNIEKENHSQLPSPTVVRGFLRLYCETVGMDPNSVLNLYQENLDACLNESSRKHGRKRRFLQRLILLTGIIGLAAAGGYHYLAQQVEERPPKTVQPVTASIAEEEPDAGGAGKNTVPKKEAALRPHKLRVKATEETWLKLIIDGKNPEEYNLAPGDQLELEAKKRFNILIGNAGGVKLTLDEKPFLVSGKTGQVVTLDLP